MQTEEAAKDIQSRWDVMWQAVLKKYRETGKSACSDDDIELLKGLLAHKARKGHKGVCFTKSWMRTSNDNRMLG